MDFVRKISIYIGTVIFLMISAQITYADGLSAVGNWVTIDHQTNQPSSIIRIWEENNRFYGKVAKIYMENGHHASDRCTQCRDYLHNKPILGLQIINNFVALGEGKYINGRILDPSSGKLYHCKMQILDKGQ